jgi:hypothetical protein
MIGTSSHPDLYPIQLANIVKSQEIELEHIILRTPIHIHTPTAHLGLIHRGVNDQSVRSKDIVFDIKALIGQLLDYNIYGQLSGEMKVRVETAFMQRCGNNSVAAASWDVFSTGEYTAAGPIGTDLLLGCTGVWGLECISLGGYSVVHLA